AGEREGDSNPGARRTRTDGRPLLPCGSAVWDRPASGVDGFPEGALPLDPAGAPVATPAEEGFLLSAHGSKPSPAAEHFVPQRPLTHFDSPRARPGSRAAFLSVARASANDGNGQRPDVQQVQLHQRMVNQDGSHGSSLLVSGDTSQKLRSVAGLHIKRGWFRTGRTARSGRHFSMGAPIRLPYSVQLPS